MQSCHLSVDANALVQHVRCTIQLFQGSPAVQILFQNRGRPLQAIKFQATGYNQFREILPVNGQETFPLVLQDLHLAPGETYRSPFLWLPQPEIRHLKLVESQVCYADGTVVPYPGPDPREYDLEWVSDTEDEDRALWYALQQYDRCAHFLPRQEEDHWLCVCGQWNGNEEETCRNCQKSRAQTFARFSGEALAATVEQAGVAMDRFADQELQQESESQSRSRRMKVFAVCGVLLLFLLMILLFHACWSKDPPSRHWYARGSVSIGTVDPAAVGGRAMEE